MPLTTPLNNNVLIEVQRDYDDVSRTDSTESMKYGKLVGYSVSAFHFTASAAFRLVDNDLLAKEKQLHGWIGKTVRWEEFAEGGQTFQEDGKTYALIPWWRLIGVTEETK